MIINYNMFLRIYLLFKTFRQSANVEYGPGCKNMLIKLYYSLFRINTFEVFTFNINNPNARLEDTDCGNTMYEFDKLDKYRISDDIPKELCCDKMHSVTASYIIEINDELAYIHWIYTKGDHSRFICLDDGVAEINNVLTLPRFRGQKIAARALRFSANRLYQDGYKKIVAVIHKQNIASIKSFVNAGFERSRAIRTIGPFNRKISL